MGAHGDMYGVKLQDLKKIAKRLRGQQSVALELWDTNNSDAMYLASLVADGALMKTSQLNHWAKSAWWYLLSEHAVPSVAVENLKAAELALKWLASKSDHIVSSGWCTYSMLLSVRQDADLDLANVENLLRSIPGKIADAPNRVRYCMNSYVISVGGYVKPLLKTAKTIARQIGKVEVDVGATSCKVPVAWDYIAKIESMGRVGKKRKTAKC